LSCDSLKLFKDGVLVLCFAVDM